MKSLSEFFGKSAAPTAAVIETEIASNELTISAILNEISIIFDGISEMADDQHLQVCNERDKLSREVERINASNVKLRKLHCDTLAAAAKTARAEATEAKHARVESARKAVQSSDKLLKEFDRVAERMAEIVAEYVAINVEAAAANLLLGELGIEDRVPSIDEVHRKHPDETFDEVRERCPCWVTSYRFGKEEVRRATLDKDGKPIKDAGQGWEESMGRFFPVQTRLETREIVVSKARVRMGAYLPTLSNISLPPGRLTSAWHWPRKETEH